MMKSRNLNRLLSLVLLAVVLACEPLAVLAQEPPSNIPTADSMYFVPATGQEISAETVSWWTTHNGATLLGMPVTAANGNGEQIFEFGSLQRSDSGALISG